MDPVINICGPIPEICERAIRKFISIGGNSVPVFLFWDDGTLLGRIEMCACFLRRFQAKPGDEKIAPFIFRGSVNKNLKSEINLSILNFVTISDLLVPTSVISLKELFPIIEGYFSDSLILHRKFNLGKETHEKPASKKLWNAQLQLFEESKPLRPNAFFVDDRASAEQKDEPGYQYLLTSGQKLKDMGFGKVFFATEIPFSKEVVVYTLKEGKMENVESWQGEKDISDIDIFFVDIVEVLQEDDKEMKLSGIQRDLSQLHRHRAILPYPQIYMLSHLRRELVSHICLSHGADYYLEKREFDLDAPKPLNEILYNTTKVNTPEIVSENENDFFEKCQSADWFNIYQRFKEKDKGLVEVEQQDCLKWCQYANLLFSKKYKIENIEFIRPFAGGMSGSQVLLVRPEDGLGTQRERVLKIDDKNQIAAEVYAYLKYIEPYSIRGFAKVESEYYLSGENAVMSYEYMGNFDETTVDRDIDELSACFLKIPHDQMLKLIKALLLNLKKIHKNSTKKKRTEWDVFWFFRRELAAIPLEELPKRKDSVEFELTMVKGSGVRFSYYDREKKNLKYLQTFLLRNPKDLLGPDYMIRPGKRFKASPPLFNDEDDKPFVDLGSALINAQGKIRKRINGENKNELMQLIHLQENLKKFISCCLKLNDNLVLVAEKALKSYDEAEPWGVVHGDVHMKNIFVSDSETWLIDYGKTREGPPAIDFVCLEYDIRNRFITPIIGHILKNNKQDPEKWLSRLLVIVRVLENVISQTDGGKIDCGILKKNLGVDDNQIEVMLVEVILKAIYAIRYLRNYAFNNLYKGKGKSYWLVLFLYLIRVVQYYSMEAEYVDGPIGTAWAAILADDIYQKKLKD